MRLIAVWGSPGSGKTTVALALAAQLARRKRDILVLGTDNGVPSLPVYLPGVTIPTSGSIGRALERTVSEETLKGRLHKHPRSEHIYFSGYAAGELPAVSYKVPQRVAVESFFQVLQGSPFHDCIVDCASSAVMDPVTLYVLEAAQIVCRTVTPDGKGWAWQQAHLTWLANSDAFAVERHKKLCNLTLPNTPMGEVKTLFGSFDAVLPYAASVGERTVAGELLAGFHDRDGLLFDGQMERLAEQLIREVEQK